MRETQTISPGALAEVALTIGPGERICVAGTWRTSQGLVLVDDAVMVGLEDGTACTPGDVEAIVRDGVTLTVFASDALPADV